MPALAAGLVSRRVDLFVAGATAAAPAAKSATIEIPIVFLTDDAIVHGLAASLAPPRLLLAQPSEVIE